MLTRNSYIQTCLYLYMIWIGYEELTHTYVDTCICMYVDKHFRKPKMVKICIYLLTKAEIENANSLLGLVHNENLLLKVHTYRPVKTHSNIPTKKLVAYIHEQCNRSLNPPTYIQIYKHLQILSNMQKFNYWNPFHSIIINNKHKCIYTHTHTYIW